VPSGSGLYRVLVRLYPREFRREFADDLIQMFGDLAERDGLPAAWRRTVVDLAVTVPRHRLETVMSARRSSTVIWLFAIIGALAGVTLLAADVASTVALIVVVIAGVVVLAQRSQLARSLRPETSGDRRRLWIQSAIGAVAAVAALAIGFADLAGEESWPAGRVLVYNLVFFVAAITAVVSFAIALRRPRTV
jgi:hypothetical protein